MSFYTDSVRNEISHFFLAFLRFLRHYTLCSIGANFAARESLENVLMEAPQLLEPCILQRGPASKSLEQVALVVFIVEARTQWTFPLT